MRRKWRRAWQRARRQDESTAKAPFTAKWAKTLLPSAAAAMFLLSATTGVYAMPANGQVTTGTGTISQNGSAMTIQQSTDKLGINWQSFNIAAKERVNFVQPNAQSVALNRVIGNDPSSIYGQLNANGKVFLVNPNGILFAPGAQVNVGGLVASTLKISDSDFKAGQYQFVKDGAAGSVVNQGNITAANGGYIALVGPDVKNEGVLVANQGTVALGAGNALTLDMNGDGLLNLAVDQGAVNASISNKQLIQANGGQVIMTTKAAQELAGTVVNNSGVVYAKSIDTSHGVIRLAGGDIHNTGTIAATGQIDVTSPNGQYFSDKGLLQAPEIRIDSQSVLGSGTIDASGIQGGNIRINTSYLSYRGSIKADGTQGDGGFITLNSPYILLNYESAVTANGTEKGGQITLNGYTGDSGFTLLSGTLSANGKLGGTIQATAPNLTLLGATVNANGDLGGGTVLLGGDWQGSGTFAKAKNVTVDNTTAIHVDANQTGNGGKVVVWSEEKTQLGGTVTARGGVISGNGGQIEISSHNDLNLWGHPDAGARSSVGQAGLLLLDPKNITIDASAGGSIDTFSTLLSGFSNWSSSTVELGIAAIAVNDNYALLGAPFANSNKGSAYLVNLLTPSQWQDLANVSGLTLLSSANFGYSVAMTNSNALIGAKGANKAYLFSNLSTVSLESTTFTELNPGSPAIGYGATVALTDNYAAIGAVDKPLGGGYVGGDSAKGTYYGGGHVYLYNRSNNQWTTITDPLTDVATGNSDFGGSIALNSTSMLVANLYYNNGDGNAYLYTLGSTTPVYTFNGTPGSQLELGSSVALNNDYALIGAFFDNGGTGKAELYRLSDYSLAVTYLGNSPSDLFGNAVALSSHYALVGSATGPNYVKMYDLTTLGDTTGLTVKSGLSAIPALAMNENHALIGVPGGTGGDVYLSSSASTPTNLYYGMTPGTDSTLSASGLAGLLATQNVVLQANNDITVNSVINAAGSGNYSLTLQAGRSINVNANITTANGDLNIIGNDTVANGVVNSNRDSGNAVITTSSATLNAGAGNVNIELRDGIDKTNYQTGNITLGTINANTITVVNRGTSNNSNIVLNHGAHLTATGTGDAIKLAVTQSASQFVNNSGSTSPFTANNGRWLVYSQNPSNDVRGNIAYDFKQYNLSYGTNGNTTSILDGHNGFIYTLAPTIQGSLTGSTSKTYNGDTTAALTNSNYTFTGAVDGDTVDVNTPASGIYSDQKVGNHKTVTVNGLTINSQKNGSANVYGYQLISTATGNIGEITPKSISVTGITANNKVYDGNTAATLNGTAVLTAADIVAGDTVSVSGTPTGTFASKNVGNGQIVTVGSLGLSGTDAGNYTLSPYTTTADITPKNVTISLAGAVNREYNGSNVATLSAGNYSLTGVLGSDSVQLNNPVSGTYDIKTVGVNKAVTVTGLSLSGTDAGNYQLPSTTVSGNVGTITAKNITVTGITANNKVYDGNTAATLNGTAVLTAADIVAGDTVSVSGTPTGSFASKNVGNGQIVTVGGLGLSGTDAINYTLSPYTTTANITAKDLIVSLTGSVSREYNGNNAATLSAGNYSLTGVLGSDSVQVNNPVSGTYDTKTVGVNKAVTVTGLSLSGTDAGNYQLPSAIVNGNVGTITAKTITVTGITANNKVYDGSTAATVTGTAGLNGVIGSEAVSVDGTPIGTFVTKDVANGKTVSITGLNLSGTDAGNYTLGTSTTTANITPKNITFTGITANNKVYDGNTAATVTGIANLSGVLAGDTVSLSGTAAGSFATKDVANGKTVSITGFSLGGADAVNYTLTPYVTTADITAKSISVTGITANNKVYDGNTAATLNGTAVLTAADIEPYWVTRTGKMVSIS